MEVKKIIFPITLGSCCVGGISGITYYSLNSSEDLLDPKNLENLKARTIKVIKNIWKLFSEINKEIEKYPENKENLKDFWLNSIQLTELKIAEQSRKIEKNKENYNFEEFNKNFEELEEKNKTLRKKIENINENADVYKKINDFNLKIIEQSELIEKLLLFQEKFKNLNLEQKTENNISFWTLTEKLEEIKEYEEKILIKQITNSETLTEITNLKQKILKLRNEIELSLKNKEFKDIYQEANSWFKLKIEANEVYRIFKISNNNNIPQLYTYIKNKDEINLENIIRTFINAKP